MTDFELFLKLRHFGRNHRAAIGCFFVQLVVRLVVIFGGIKRIKLATSVTMGRGQSD